MKYARTLATTLALFFPLAAAAITIDTVSVENAGNAGDIQPNGIFGRVTADYRIATTEVTNAQYVEFLNAVAATDPLALYNVNMSFYSRGGIIRSGDSGSYTYSVKPDVSDGGPGDTNYTYGDKPVVFVSWYDAIRFTNWVNNGAASGGSTETGAYTLLGNSPTPSNSNSIARNSGATWFLPTENQWYKAAYYDGTNNVYFDYATKTDTAPNNNVSSNDSGNSANYYVGGYTQNESYPLTSAGAYALSSSPYGTFDQNGNAWEWTETSSNMGTQHIRRGGAYDTEATTLISSYRESLISALENEQTGFRLATVPIATGIPGDYNADNIVDAADYILYRKYLGQSVTLPNDSTAGTVTGADYDIWRAHFGQTVVGGASVAGLSEGAVPEPASVLLVCFAACLGSPRRRRPARIIGH